MIVFLSLSLYVCTLSKQSMRTSALIYSVWLWIALVTLSVQRASLTEKCIRRSYVHSSTILCVTIWF